MDENTVRAQAETDVLEHRRDHLERQIADAKLSVAIYQKMIEVFQKDEDRRALATEIEKVMRLETALAVVEEKMTC